MTTKNFGNTVIIVGLLTVFVMFVLSDWYGGVSFIDNLQFATLITYEGCANEYKGNCLRYEQQTLITLGQGLILPLIVIAVGFMISRGIISAQAVRKLLPFLSNEDDR